MTTLYTRLPPPSVEYPETDDEPMAEKTTQYRYLTTIKGGLEVLFRDRPDVFIAGDLFWYPVEGRPDIRTAPDVMVALGRPKGERRSYLQWLEGGTPPQVIFEILSPGNRPANLTEKFAFYERYGVEEYYAYDPDSGELLGWERQAGLLRPIPQMRGWVSPRLQVRFELQGNHLQLFAPDGTLFVTYEELAEDAARARAEAEAERRKAEAERRNAEAERLRAERLAARLRELGIDPEA